MPGAWGIMSRCSWNGFAASVSETPADWPPCRTVGTDGWLRIGRTHTRSNIETEIWYRQGPETAGSREWKQRRRKRSQFHNAFCP